MKTKSVLLLSIIFILSISSVFSQNTVLLKNVDIIIYTPFYKESTEKLNNFIEQKNPIIISQSDTKRTLDIEFYLEKDDYQSLDSLFPELGYVSSKEITTSNYNEEIEEINFKLKYLIKEKLAYEEEIKNMTKKDDRYYTYWENIRTIEHEIFELQSEVNEYEKENYFKINISIYDESIDMTDKKINWVNMPGVSYEMLFIESPVSNLSASQYMGFSLKYMFTKGKSYANIGAMKEFSPEIADTSRYKELFLFGFGQDFYSKYFGRGKNMFFNLYTGYNIGGAFATGESSIKTMFYLTPFFGIELFKNKYFLIDNRIGYFIPFAHNRNLRGIMYSASFNFVF